MQENETLNKTNLKTYSLLQEDEAVKRLQKKAIILTDYKNRIREYTFATDFLKIAEKTGSDIYAYPFPNHDGIEVRFFFEDAYDNIHCYILQGTNKKTGKEK